jgi:ABC-2 type transport system ATP-binding protein
MNDIETINLTKRYGDRTVVNHLNLSIAHGELFALLGVNGAGKTTTIRMLSCLTRPTEGDAKILGYSILSDTEKVKAAINVSPQETAVAPNLSVHENLEFIYGIYGHNRAESTVRADEFIEKFNMQSISKQSAKTLSGGWQRRLSIAMALITDPKILFLDEPTLGLDVLARRELWSIIEELKGHTTIILTTHYLEEAEALSDRIGIIRSGELVAIGTAPELTASCGAKSFEDAFITLAGSEVQK